MTKENWRIVNPITFFRKFETRMYYVNNSFNSFNTPFRPTIMPRLEYDGTNQWKI